MHFYSVLNQSFQSCIKIQWFWFSRVFLRHTPTYSKLDRKSMSLYNICCLQNCKFFQNFNLLQCIDVRCLSQALSLLSLIQSSPSASVFLPRGPRSKNWNSSLQHHLTKCILEWHLQHPLWYQFHYVNLLLKCHGRSFFYVWPSVTKDKIP